MRIDTQLIVAAILTCAAQVAGQSEGSTNPKGEPGFVNDSNQRGVYEFPTTGTLDDTSIPANALPRLAWLRADYLFWWAKTQEPNPPLIQAVPDSLEASNTNSAASTTLFPNTAGHIGYRVFGGGRINAGFWFSAEQCLGLEGSFFILEQNSTGAGYNSTGSPILARPYTNANTGVSSILQFSNPNATTGYSGSLAAVASLAPMWNIDVSLRWNGFRLLTDNTDWLVGARYFEMREQLQIVGRALLQSGTQLDVSDSFSVSNQFYGGQLGIHGRLGNYYGFSVDGVFKLAIGAVRERAVIRGSNTLTSSSGTANQQQATNPNIAVLPANLAAGLSSTQETGLYAQPTNLGVHERNVFAVIPELTVNLNYNITERAALFVGYNFFYLSNIIRVAGLIDRNINNSYTRYIANPTGGNVVAPVYRLNWEDFWMQGINLGMRLEY